MSARKRQGFAALATRAASGSQWQQLSVGDRVTPIGAGKRGTVAGVILRSPDGITTHVSVRWDRSERVTAVWATDFLTIMPKQGGHMSEFKPAPPSTVTLAEVVEAYQGIRRLELALAAQA